jgi:4'-phosphopantetheinyl transferase
MRVLLSRYVPCEPHRLNLRSSRYGKPFLWFPNDETLIQFNFSRSHQSALLAVAIERQVGVDIEFCGGLSTDRDFVAEDQIFSAEELQELKSLPPRLRAQAFYNCWTRKEAVAKAIGYGLSLPLEALRVSFAPSKPARILRTSWDATAVYRWSLHSLQTVDGYVGALAVEGHDWTLCYETFDM